jgi:prevent-host-death family protein
MAHQLSAAQAKSRLADCLRKAERGESVIITRRGRPVAALVAVDRVTLPKSKGSRASLGLAGLAGGWKGSEDLAGSRSRRSRSDVHRPAPAECTLAELVKVLRNGPKPDRGYAETLAAITRRQPKLPRSPWRR